MGLVVNSVKLLHILIAVSFGNARQSETIDNTKKLVLEGLSEALHVSVEWLKGETEEYETDITDKRELFIRDVMSSILSKLPFDMEQAESDFSKDFQKAFHQFRLPQRNAVAFVKGERIIARGYGKEQDAL